MNLVGLPPNVRILGQVILPKTSSEIPGSSQSTMANNSEATISNLISTTPVSVPKVNKASVNKSIQLLLDNIENDVVDTPDDAENKEPVKKAMPKLRNLLSIENKNVFKRPVKQLLAKQKVYTKPMASVANEDQELLKKGKILILPGKVNKTKTIKCDTHVVTANLSQKDVSTSKVTVTKKTQSTSKVLAATKAISSVVTIDKVNPVESEFKIAAASQGATKTSKIHSMLVGAKSIVSPSPSTSLSSSADKTVSTLKNVIVRNCKPLPKSSHPLAVPTIFDRPTIFDKPTKVSAKPEVTDNTPEPSAAVAE